MTTTPKYWSVWRKRGRGWKRVGTYEANSGLEAIRQARKAYKHKVLGTKPLGTWIKLSVHKL